jgi:hypothetical protein
MITIESARHRQPAALALFVVFGASRLTWTGRSIFSVNGDKFLLFEICKPAKGGGRKPEPTIPTSNQVTFPSSVPKSPPIFRMLSRLLMSSRCWSPAPRVFRQC